MSQHCSRLKAALGLEDLLSRWLPHMAVGKRPRFLIDSWQKALLPHDVDLSIGQLKCPRNMALASSSVSNQGKSMRKMKCFL